MNNYLESTNLVIKEMIKREINKNNKEFQLKTIFILTVIKNIQSGNLWKTFITSISGARKTIE